MHFICTIPTISGTRLENDLLRPQQMDGLYDKYLVMSQLNSFKYLALLMIIINTWVE